FPRHSFESVVDRKPLSKITITGFREMRQCEVGSDVLWLLALGSWLLALGSWLLASWLQLLQNQRSQLRDAACAQRQHHVARLSEGCNRGHGVRKRGSVGYAPLPCPHNAASENFRRDAFDRLLAGRVNVEEAKRVGIGEGGRELIHQIASAGKTVRLEDHMHAAKSALTGGGQRGSDLRRMMAVIVNHADARSLALELEAAVHAAKTVERGTNLLRGNVERGAHRNRRRRVQHVVRARNVQREFAEILLFVSDLETDERAVLSGGQLRLHL